MDGNVSSKYNFWYLTVVKQHFFPIFPIRQLQLRTFTKYTSASISYIQCRCKSKAINDISMFSNPLQNWFEWRTDNRKLNRMLMLNIWVLNIHIIHMYESFSIFIWCPISTFTSHFLLFPLLLHRTWQIWNYHQVVNSVLSWHTITFTVSCRIFPFVMA